MLFRSIWGNISTGCIGADQVETQVLNLQVTIKTTGRPVIIFLVADGANTAFIGFTDKATPAGGGVYFSVKRDGQLVGEYLCEFSNTGNDFRGYVPASSIRFLDLATKGNHTYTIYARPYQPSSSANSVTVKNTKLVAYEL